MAESANGEFVAAGGVAVTPFATQVVDPSTKTIYIMLQNVSGGDRYLTSSTFLNTAAKAIPQK